MKKADLIVSKIEEAVKPAVPRDKALGDAVSILKQECAH